MNNFVLAIIDNPHLVDEFGEIARRGEAAGYTVLRYADDKVFQAADSDHPSIAAILCLGQTRCDAALIARMPRLALLLSAVTGIEGFDIEAATARGVLIGNGQVELNYIQMAEATILLILAALYDFNFTQRVLREGVPQPHPLRARLLRHRTIGFVGFGRIAQEVARRLAAWDAPMIAYVHRPNPSLEKFGVKPVELESLLREADIVSLHCSLNAQTRHIIDARRLASMKNSAIIVNTGRGGLIDEAALCAALAEGQIAGAALDVFEVEPLPAASPLRQLPNVILTPHSVGHTDECQKAIMENAWESIRRVAHGEPPVLLKNPDALAAWQARYAVGGTC